MVISKKYLIFSKMGGDFPFTAHKFILTYHFFYKKRTTKGNYIKSGQPFCVYKLHREWSQPISVIGKKKARFFSFFLNYIESGDGLYL